MLCCPAVGFSAVLYTELGLPV